MKYYIIHERSTNLKCDGRAHGHWKLCGVKKAGDNIEAAQNKLDEVFGSYKYKYSDGWSVWFYGDSICADNLVKKTREYFYIQSV